MMPMEKLVGIESTFESVWEALQDDNLGKIGLYGMGGVGKTTLLKRINNEFCQRRNNVFDVAIWVVVSKQATEEKIQRDILQKLQIPPERWRDTIEENSALIYEKLKGRRYILMLDDVWKRLDLLLMGVPSPDNQNKCKIIFTTRSEDVCSRMRSEWKIKVMCLPQEKALQLFLENVGEDALSSHHEIPLLAKLVAEECKGLPLALITIGRAMASRKMPYEWSYALQQLKEYASEFPDMGNHVLPVLKFSFDNLADFTTQICFFYCSLFPEDYEMEKEKLVDLWMGEGYLKELDVRTARNHGYSIIEELKRACLLETGVDSSFVKMHDVLRDMALWIASEYGKNNKKFIVLEEVELTTVNWNDEVEKMSLWGNTSSSNSYNCGDIVEMFSNLTNCIFPQLSTLVVDSSHLKRSFGMGSSKFVPCLRVLDLSARNFVESPVPLEVKGISELINLEYLNLSSLPIHRLPKEFKRLRKLRYLLMDQMRNLKECPTEIIFGLTELLVFRMDNKRLPYPEKFMRGLDSLQKLQETGIYVTSIDSLEIFRNSEKLQRCAKSMKLKNIDVNVLKMCPTKMRNLEFVQIFHSNFKTLECSPTLMVFNHLRRVVITNCDYLEELDFLTYASSLEKLNVGYCQSLQRILCVVDEYVGKCRGIVPVFSSLKCLELLGLPNLEIICNKPLSFPTLESITIKECPKLQQNPFNDMTPTNKLEEIKVEKEWWDSLNWRHDNGILRDCFSHYLKD